MFSPENLEAELTKAKELITRSKDTILGLQALVKTRESEIANHVASLDNAAKLTTTVATISDKFKESFKDFEAFLGSVSNTSYIEFVDYPSSNSSNPVLSPKIHVGNMVVETPTDRPVHDSHSDPTRIGPLAVKE